MFSQDIIPQELLTARQDSEEKSVELEHVHADCMLLEDQLLLKNEVTTTAGRLHGSNLS